MPVKCAPLLLPAPKSLKLLRGWAEVPDELTVCGAAEADPGIVFKSVLPARAVGDEHAPWVRCQVEPDAGPPESYTLVIRADSRGSPQDPTVHITAADGAGARHGLRTLAQLLLQYQDRLPAVKIEDAPSFQNRGVMLDISRDRVPKMEEIFACVDLFASWKMNHLELYTEHTFAYAGHEEVWRTASPMTVAEVRALDVHAAARGVRLGANQNCFGHMERWLKHARYRPLAEIPAGGSWELWGRRRTDPWGLCPGDPGAIALVEDLLGQLLPNFSGRWVNIGCDETWDLGQGRSREACARDGMIRVYFDFIMKILDCVRRHGFRAGFWADIAFHHPEALALVPEDLTALAWGYEPEAPFDRWCAALRRAGREFWVCPGTSSWCSITGRTFERRGNLAAAARAGKAEGARGYLVTDWGDMGHRQQWPISLHGLAEAAHVAWNAGQAESFDPRASSLHAFGDHSLKTGRWLDELGDVDRALRRVAGGVGADGKPRPIMNRSCFFADLHSDWDGPFRAGDARTWRAFIRRLDELSARLPTTVDGQVQSELRHTVAVARLATERAAMRRDAQAATPQARRALAVRLRELTEEHRRLWLARSRPGGLEDSCRHYERVAAELEGTAGR